MPPVIEGIKWLIVAGIKASAGAYGATIQFLTNAAAAALLTVTTNKLFGPKLPKGAGLSGQQVMTRSAMEYRKIVYGQAMVSGPIVYNNLSGTDGEYLWFVIALADGESDDFVSIWFDGDEIPKADIDWTAGTGGADGTGTGDVSTSRWVGENSTAGAQLFYYLGHPDQFYSFKLSQGFPATWDTNHRGRGVTYMVAKLLYNEDTADVWKSGPPQNIKALVKGRKLYDPRLDSTVVITNVDDNLVLYSEQANNAAWLKGACTVDANADTDPDGGSTADRINVTASTSEHRITQLVTNTTAGNTYTASAYVKDDGAGFATLAFVEFTEDFFSATFDLSDGSVTKTDVGTGAGVVDASGASDAGDGWWRIWVKGSTFSGGANTIYSYVAASDAGTFTGNGVGVNEYLAGAGDDLLVWGMQVNNDSLGNYAQTTSSAITDTLGSGSHRYTDSSTWEWSDNPALCTADYLFNVMDVDAASSIDWPSIATAADFCDETVDIGPAASPTNTQKRFTCNGATSLGQSHKDNLDAIISSCDGKLSYTAGVWKLRASEWEASSVSITADDLAGDVEVRGSAPKAERFNLIRGFFIDPDRKHESTEFPHVSAAAYLTRDASQTIAYDLSLPFTNNQYMAQRIAYRVLEQGDNQVICTLTMNERGAKVAIGDVVDVTLDDYGWSAKTFRCIEWSRESNGTFKITLREDDSSDYVDPLVAEYQDVNSADPAAEVNIVPAPTGLAATSILNGVKLTWTDPASRLYDRIEIWQSSSDSLSGASQIATVSGSPFIDVVSESQNKRYYWIRAVRNSGAASSYEPNNSPDTGVGAFPLVQQQSLVADPFIRQGSSYFDFTAGGAYVVGGGTDSTDAISITSGVSVSTVRTAARRGPDTYDPISSNVFSVEVRWRFKLHDEGSLPSPQGAHFPLTAVVTIESDASPNEARSYTTVGNLDLNSITTGTWYEDSATVEIDETARFGGAVPSPRYIRIGIQDLAVPWGQTYYIDFLDASIVSGQFRGANKPGIVPNPTAEQGYFLQDDGTFSGTHAITDAENTSPAITITNYNYPPGDVRRYGVTGDGVTDDLAAMDVAISIGIPLYFPELTYVVSAEVDFTNAKFVYFENAIFQPSHSTGKVIKIESTAGNFTEGYKWTGLITVDWVTADWTADRTSFYFSNVYDSEFHIASRRSTVGLRLYGNDKGVVYNDFYLNKFADNNIGVWLSTKDSTGWCNANRFHGGYFSGSETVSGSLYESTASHIYIETTPYSCNGNTFYSPSLEFVGAGFRLARLGGSRNTLQVGYAEVNSGDTTWLDVDGTKNTLDCYSTAYLNGYDSTLSGANNRVDASGATEPYILGAQEYVDFDGKGTQERRVNHSTEPAFRAYNAGGGPAITARASSDSAGAVVLRNPGDTQNNVSIPSAGWWVVYNANTNVHWKLSAAPTSGTWVVGDKAFNSAPSVDGNNMILIGWICTVAGTPGTWQPMYVSNVSPAT